MNMNTHKANAVKTAFAIAVIILIVCYICIKYTLLKDPFLFSASQSAQQRRILLLYHTDHEALLKAGREIFRQGPKDPYNYIYLGPQHIEGFPVPRGVHIPKVIRKLRPHASLINRNGYVVLQMQGGRADFGVRIYPEGFNGKRYYFTSGNRELLAGLEYFDYKYDHVPEYDKRIDEIIQKGRWEEPNNIDLSKSSK